MIHKIWLIGILPFNKRNQIGSRFTSTIFGTGKNITTGKSYWDWSFLNWGWYFPSKKQSLVDGQSTDGVLPFFINSHQKLTLQTHIFEADTFCVGDIGCFNSVILEFFGKNRTKYRTFLPLPVCWAFVSRLDLLRQLGWFSWGMRMPYFFISFEKFFFFVVSQKWKIYFWNEIIEIDFYSTEKLFDWIQMRSETKKTIRVENQFQKRLKV